MKIAIEADTGYSIKQQLIIDAHEAMIEQFDEEIKEYEENGPIKWEAD